MNDFILTLSGFILGITAYSMLDRAHLANLAGDTECPNPRDRAIRRAILPLSRHVDAQNAVSEAERVLHGG